MKSFLAMLSFFTRIPVGAKYALDDTVFKKGIKYLAVIALIIGVPVGLASLLRAYIGTLPAALIALILYLLTTGGLHVDGLADTMDAFGSCRDRQKMLDIMRDSRIGTFGVLAVCIYVVGMVLFMARANVAAVWLFPLAGRTAGLLCARAFPYARQQGMGKSFTDAAKTVHVIAAAVVYAAAAVAVSFDFAALRMDTLFFAALAVPYVLSVGTVVFAAAGMAKKLGGMTGDSIGFCIETAQLVYLLVSCVIMKVW